MKIVLVGDFCEIDEVCTRAGHDIVHIVNSEEDEFYLGAGDKSTPLVIVPDGGSRRNIAMRYEKAGFRFATIVAKTADVSASATIGEGTVIAEHAIVTAKTLIGRFVKINTAAKVTHECRVGDFATIAPAAVILGRVTIGEGAYIGANSTILPEVRIGKNAVVGAGALVTKDVPDGETWVGVPARRLK